ncbi:hypothetical protein EJ110_NYTH05836 [Nymphaea thermarum]|nr:hypothetical protein EJ110_NYTH05836 [Nymphaea thermarum]
MVETRSQAKQALQNEASSSELWPETLGLPAIEPEAYHIFHLFMERFMKEQEEEKALMVTPEPENEKAAKQKRKKKKQKRKKKKNKSSPTDQDEDYLSSDSAIRDEDVKGLPREFIRYDGTTCPHVHLSTFFNDCYKIQTNNRALFRYFPRRLEGIAAQWYKENVNPIELKEFEKLINMFVERFEQNAPMAPTLSNICCLRQKQGEKAREFIQKWRIQCNKIKEPISETQALSLIRKNLAQPLKSLIRNSPIKTFVELIEQANSIEEGIEEGDFDGIIAPKYKEDGKKGGRTQLPAHFIANAGIRKDHGNNYKHDKEVSFKKNTQFLKGDDERKNKHPGWSYNRKFTPLNQSREKILEYLFAKGTIVLPKVSEPQKMMGGNKEKLCKFHRAPGHDTEDCFVLKNIIQYFINKYLKICDDSTPEILRNPFPDHGKAAVAMITTGTPLPYHPQDHIRPYIGSSSQKVMVVDQSKEPLDFIAMMNGRIESLPKKLPIIPRTFILQGDESSDVSSHEDPCYLDILSLEERMVEGYSVQASKNQSITFSEKDLPK